MIEHAAFLASVRAYVEAHPDVAPHVTEFVADGLRARLAQAVDRAADMEVALAMAVQRRTKNSDAVIRQKVEKWKGRTSLNWDWLP